MLGTIFWTVGLFASVTFVLIHVMHVYPRIISSIHIAFGNLAFILALAIGSMVAGMRQVRRGLSTVDELRTRLSSVHRGEADRVTGSYPTEVQPLVDDLNALLDHRKDLVQRAIAKAGDLAHRLKTPLAVLSQEAQRAERDGHLELAASLGSQVDRMRTQIDYHLAHARAAASGATPGTHCQVLPSVDALSRTLRQLYTERGITIEVCVAPEHAVRCQREDLEEMLGNLLDNACKWARGCIIVRSCETGDGFTLITVEDDGPGLAAAMRDSVLKRGVRADEATPGSGLGLAIVRDLAELYGGSIELGESGSGGVSARLRLPTPSKA